MCDLNDGGPPGGPPPHAVASTPAGALVVTPDEEGFVVLEQEAWVAPSNGGIYRMPIGDPARGHAWASLAFSTASRAATSGMLPTEEGFAKTFSTGNTPGVERIVVDHPGSIDSGQTIVWSIPLSVFAAHGMVVPAGDMALIEPSSVWSNLVYKPRYEGLSGDEQPQNGYTFGAGRARSDHPAADVTRCRNADDVDDAIHWCPESGGFMSLAKNALLPDADVRFPDDADVAAARQADLLDYATTGFVGIA